MLRSNHSSYYISYLLSSIRKKTTFCISLGSPQRTYPCGQQDTYMGGSLVTRLLSFTFSSSLTNLSLKDFHLLTVSSTESESPTYQAQIDCWLKWHPANCFKVFVVDSCHVKFILLCHDIHPKASINAGIELSSIQASSCGRRISSRRFVHNMTLAEQTRGKICEGKIGGRDSIHI